MSGDCGRMYFPTEPPCDRPSIERWACVPSLEAGQAGKYGKSDALRLLRVDHVR